jgi:hypothetical protein
MVFARVTTRAPRGYLFIDEYAQARSAPLERTSAPSGYYPLSIFHALADGAVLSQNQLIYLT